ncbi:M48 family metallopeptidase [Halovenus salina]|uniref:M48 family metallopeptidase n=1 Tax=Halovenus salina TaxID=1510225 RepID=UPI002260EE51|nr:M48 family metalloprotease [Halovenus salina]
MSRTLQQHLSLAGRLAVASIVVGAVSVTIAVTAAFLTGLVICVGILFAGFLLGLLLAPVTDSASVLGVLSFSTSQWLAVILGSGLLVAPPLYLRTARRNIQLFETELGTAGTPAKDRHPEIAAICQQLAQQTDIPAPDIRIVNRRRPESYSLADGSGGTIVISRGVIRQLDREEVRAVLAHEVSHLANGDTHVLRWLLVPMLVAEHLGQNERPSLGEGHLIVGLGYVVHLFAWACVRLVTTVQLWLCQFGIALLSRGREFAADAASAQLTGSPSSLANALRKLDDARSRPSRDKRDFMRSAGVLDILPVERRTLGDGPFRTHPKTEVRISRLESLVKAVES